MKASSHCRHQQTVTLSSVKKPKQMAHIKRYLVTLQRQWVT